MNIIFGDVAKHLSNNHIVLQLDTFRLPNQPEPVIAWCLVEKPSLAELGNLESYKNLHADLIKCYQQRKWQYCIETIETLLGKWGGELDSFYQDLLARVNQYVESEPAEDWDGTRLKSD